MIANLDQIATNIKAAKEKEIIVIIDGLDDPNSESIINIYKNKIKDIFKPSFRIIFTINIEGYRHKDIKPIIDKKTNGDVVTMLALNIFEKGANRLKNPIPIAETQEVLREILAKRIPENMLKPDMADKIALYSGGVITELMLTARECCRICLKSIRRHRDLEQLAIDDAVLEKAVENRRESFASNLSKSDYEILQKVYKENEPEDPSQPEFLKLVNGLHIIEYQGNWYDVNPIVKELLRDKNLV